MKKFIVAAISLLVLNTIVYSQQVSGEWYGIGSVNRNGQHSSYLAELVLQQKGNKVTGEFNYYFKSTSTVIQVSGIFDERTRTLELKAHPLLNYKTGSVNGADCPMEGSFTLLTSRVESSLRGQFNPTENYKYTCPAINIKFVKQTKKLPEIIPPAELETEEEQETKTDATKIVKGEPAKPDPNAPLIAAFNSRLIEPSPVIDVNADSLRITLYDNGDVDGDTISLFHNRKLIAVHQVLRSSAFTITLPLDTNVNEISMFAENLGSIPPNTALCVIYAGQQRFEMSMASTYIKNATIRFRKKVLLSKELVHAR